METEKFIYGFDSYCILDCKIKQYQVIKETPKTYTVGRPHSIYSNSIITTTVKKSTMQTYSIMFAETYEQALELLKQTLAKRIETNTQNIIYRNSQNEKLAARLKELQAGGGNNDG